MGKRKVSKERNAGKKSYPVPQHTIKCSFDSIFVLIGNYIKPSVLELGRSMHSIKLKTPIFPAFSVRLLIGLPIPWT